MVASHWRNNLLTAAILWSSPNREFMSLLNLKTWVINQVQAANNIITIFNWMSKPTCLTWNSLFPLQTSFPSSFPCLNQCSIIILLIQIYNLWATFNLSLPSFFMVHGREKELGPSLCSNPLKWGEWKWIELLSCPTLCNPMDCSTPGLPVHHQLPEFTQTHVHWLGDTIQPSHPCRPPFPSTVNLSQHQGLFQQVSSSHQEAKVLEFQLQHQSFHWTPRTGLL